MEQQLLQQETEKKKLSERYQQLIKDTEVLRNKTTLELYYIYKEAYEIGKKLKSNSFSYAGLARDFKVTRNSIERILSLRNATQEQWAMINNREISSYKVALILQRKGNTEIAGELIKEVAKKKLTVFDINSFSSRTREELAIERKERAIMQGYSRKQDAYIGTSKTLSQMDLIVLLPLNKYSNDKGKEVLRRMKLLKKKLGIYLRRYDG